MSTTTGARIAGSAPPGGPGSIQAVGPPVGRAARTVLFLVIGVLALVTSVTVGYAVGAPQSPADDSAEAGFARGMQVHHAQAVEMAFVIRDRTTDPLVRTVAYDIITSQQQQIGQMYAWLARWNLPQTSNDAPMAWMDSSAGMAGMGGMGGGNSGVDTGTGSAATMPGMATGTDLRRLRAARGQTAEVLFLRLMIKHHRGGVAMANAVLARTERPEVRRLARTIRTAQRAEIEQMTQLLADRGSAP